MKKLGIVFCVVFMLGATLFTFLRPFITEKRSPTLTQDYSISEIDTYLKKKNESIAFSDVRTTEELRLLLNNYDYDKTPRIFVRNFPSDFKEKGDLPLFVRTLLPHILRENELLSLERKAFLKLADKIKTHQNLTSKESAFFNDLVLKYEVLKPDLAGQADKLYDQIDRISPSLAIVQALYGTMYMDENFNSPFDVYRWNKEKQYERVIYPNLAEAVADYALELNRGISYDSFHHKRSIYRDTQYELPGSVFAGDLSLYMIEEKEYTDTLLLLFNDIDSYELDFATFKKGK